MNKRYYELRAKWLSGIITPDEKIELLDWFGDNEYIRMEIPPAFAENRELLGKRIFDRMVLNMPAQGVGVLPLNRQMAKKRRTSILTATALPK